MRKLILAISLLILLLAVAHSEWEIATPPTYVEETVYEYSQFVRHTFWLDQADSDSVQVIFENRHYTTYNSPDVDQMPTFDSVSYDTVRYYRK